MNPNYIIWTVMAIVFAMIVVIGALLLRDTIKETRE